MGAVDGGRGGASARLALWYGAISLAIMMLHNVFVVFYVEEYVNAFGERTWAFYVGQAIFLVWNAVNDPLLGWLEDRAGLARSSAARSRTSDSIVARRARALRLAGPAYAASFALVWFRWLPLAIQFPLCLCLYDGFWTFVDLNNKALLSDLSVTQQDRLFYSRANAAMSIIGSVTIYGAYSLRDPVDPAPFRLFIVLVSAASAAIFAVAALRIERLYSSHFGAAKVAEPPHGSSSPASTSWLAFMRELGRNRNFVLFGGIYFLQVFHCSFNSNFIAPFLDALVGDAFPRALRSLVLTAAFVLPHVNVFAVAWLAQRRGLFVVMRLLFASKVAVGVVLLLAGGHALPALLLSVILTNRIFTEGTCRVISLVVADIVDEDYVLNARSSSLSALIFGAAALIAKPGQTIAPVFGAWMLERATGSTSLAAEHLALHSSTLIALLTIVPLVCGTAQLMLWQRFGLKDDYLAWVRSQLHRPTA